MRLDFNLLWVEDQPDNVEPSRQSVELKLRKHGFRLQTQFAKSVDEAKTFLRSDVYGDHIDLILMDYDLGAGSKGDDGLIQIRNVFPYKDILFYSARTADLKALVAAKRVQGVFCCGRLDLPETVDGIFEALVKKVLDIDHARGIIMGSSSVIDGLVVDCLSAHCNQNAGVLPAHAAQLFAKRVKKLRAAFTKDVERLEKATTIPEIEKQHRIYTSMDRQQLLCKILDDIGQYTDECKFIKDYIDKTVPLRNILAHVRVEKKGFSCTLRNKDGSEFTSEMVTELRNALLKHEELLEKILRRMSQ